MENDSNTGVADMYVSKEVMIYGILTNKILVGATVIGFSRTANYMNQEFFDEKSEVFSVLNVDFDDIKEIIQDLGQFSSTIQHIGLNQILFVMNTDNSSIDLKQ